MFKFFYSLFEKAYDRKVSTTGLALFRIIWGAVLFIEVSEMRQYKELRFDFIPFIERSELNIGPFLLIWQLILIMFILGYKTKITTTVNYIYSILFFACITSYEYHIFHVFLCINLVLIITPISKSYSIDHLLAKIKYSNSKNDFDANNNTTILYYYLIILLGLGFVYIDSVIYKLGSPTWMTGLGMWRPSVLPNFNISDWNELFNLEWLVICLGYLTILFELTFVLLMWYRKFRVPLFLIGFGLHLGILIFFPIPIFALGYLALYTLLVPVKYWLCLFSKFQLKQKKLTFIFDPDCPLCVKTKIAISSLDILKAIDFKTIKEAKEIFKDLNNIGDDELAANIYSITKTGRIRIGYQTYIKVCFNMIYTAPIALTMLLPGIKQIGEFIYTKIAKNRTIEKCNSESCLIETYPQKNEEKKIASFINLKQWKTTKLLIIFLFFILLQINSSMHSVIAITNPKSSKNQNSKIYNISIRAKEVFSLFTGVTNHSLFTEGHYAGFKDLFAVTHIDQNMVTWLPIIDSLGRPGKYNTGANFAKWTFRVNTPMYNQNKLKDGLRIFTAFWLAENNIQMEGATFIIKHKPIYSPDHFVPNQLEKLEAIPWNDVGTFTWSNETPELIINEEEITKYY